MRKSIFSSRVILLLTLAILPRASGRVYEEVVDLASFRYASRSGIGLYSTAPAILGSDGHLYGTTYFGGLEREGNVFRLTSTREFTTLAEFAETDGRHADAALVEGSDGNFYGTTFLGGSDDHGSIFRLTPGGQFTTLVHFTGNGPDDKGDRPRGLVEAADGNFYGATMFGGAQNCGTLFRMTPAGSLATLVQFSGTGGANKGARPYGTLIEGADGNLYGSTWAGGGDDCGTLFRMTPGGVLTTLVEFTGNGAENKGSRPRSALLQAGDGCFYGTTDAGGEGFMPGEPSTGNGTVFRMNAAGTLTTLMAFAGGDPTRPCGPIVEAADGNLYGTTIWGGAFGEGSVYRISPSGSVTTLVEFGAPGTLPSHRAQLTLDHAGNLVGTTHDGIFRVGFAGEIEELVRFAGFGWMSIGSEPAGEMVPDGLGNLYGATRGGGLEDKGAIFKFNETDGITPLVSFTGNGAGNRGAFPSASLMFGPDGNFYGATMEGGAHHLGTIFRMTPGGDLTTLVDFTGTGGTGMGSWPGAALIPARDGYFYGTTERGGALDQGTVFRMTPAGVLTTLVEFTATGGINRGAFPATALVEHGDGNFYGTTTGGGSGDHGTIFRMTPAGVLTTLVEFTGRGGTSKGADPGAALFMATDGSFYGSTRRGGVDNKGTIFRLTPAGVLTTLVEFTGEEGDAEGSRPMGSLLQAADGFIYGTTSEGGSGDLGTHFRLSLTGEFLTILEYGNYGNDDGRPCVGFSPLPNGDYYSISTGVSSDPVTGGSVYKLNFDGPPGVSGLTGESLATDSAQVTAMVHPAGQETTVVVEYGTDSGNLAHAVSTPPGTVNGSSDLAVSAVLAGLEPGTTYHFRVRAGNSSGVTESWTGGVTTLTDLEMWRLSIFGTTESSGQALDDADPDHDGLSNLLEYCLGHDPLVSNPDDVILSSFTTEQDQRFLTLTVTRASVIPGVTCDIEVTGDLRDWEGDVTVLEDSATVLKARDNVPVSAAPMRAIRLRVDVP